MITKRAESDDGASISVESQSVLADPKLMDRVNKFAAKIKNIAPKSDDFLYFSIIFLRSAEACIVDDIGGIKKLATGEDAWGYFDDEWKWHGNVQPHKNNNGDIFPESELIKAASDWIGMPLCRDHESSSVDGIRGIILDTYYDKKLKQIVGLCALDKVNYPDLARKVETGMVRYGSMGTAVEISICTECGNRATTLDEYCDHVTERSAYGEINVGLKPIEYSLVVQPAEPGARLLSCIASLNNYRDEFINYGVDDFDSMVSRLSEPQAEHLNNIMKAACSDGGCSIPQRRKIVAGFLKENNLVKSAHTAGRYSTNTTPDEASSLSKAMSELRTSTGYTYEQAAERKDDSEIAKEVFGLYRRVIDAFQEVEMQEETELKGPLGESFTDPENVVGEEMPPSFSDPESSALADASPDWRNIGPAGITTPSEDREEGVFNAGGVLPDSDPVIGASSKESKTIIQSLMEDIMNESRLRKRAELRRRIAYHQGGADGVEPSTYKSEDWNRDQDKHMQQTGKMGGDKGMWPGDKEVKEKLSRAELVERRLKRMAYHQGGSDGVEPSTYKSEDYKNLRDKQDKQMLQDGNMGGVDGMWPGDKEIKEKQSRAKYNGPSLRTKFSHKKNLDGTLNRANSRFQVYAGDKKVIDVLAGNIFGPELNENWRWLNSRDYGKEVVAQIRENGLQFVSGLLKSAQDLEGAPALEPMPPAPEGGPPGLGAAMPDGGDLPPLGSDEEGEELEAEESPRDAAENALLSIEQEVETLRELLAAMGGEEEVNINIDLDDDDIADIGGEGLEGLALARNVAKQVKTAISELGDSADELAMINETYENVRNLNRKQVSELSKLTRAAVKDSYHLCGEASALSKVARRFGGIFVKSAEFVESTNISVDVTNIATEGVKESVVSDGVDELVSEAVSLRKSRRESILRRAEDKALGDRRKRREAVAKRALAQAVDGASNAADDASNAADGMTNAVDDASSDDDDDASNAADGMTNAADDASNAADDVSSAADDASNAADDAPITASYVKDELDKALEKKMADEDRDSYKVKVRRAYDLAMEMQRKGLVPSTKPMLDRQVDEIMLFDDRAFEAFKRSISHAKSVRNIKVATDLGGINIGVEDSSMSVPGSTLETLASMWE